MKRFSCHECREYLPAYVSRELPPLLRRRVGGHLDTCEACYTVYLRQRAVTQELSQQVPLIGQADAPRLSKIWSAVQAEMARPRPTSWRQMPGRRTFALVILVVALLLPSLGFEALQRRQVAMALPVPPTPTETVGRTNQAVAMATAGCACSIDTAATAVPEYRFSAQPNYAPNANATESP